MSSQTGIKRRKDSIDDDSMVTKFRRTSLLHHIWKKGRIIVSALFKFELNNSNIDTTPVDDIDGSSDIRNLQPREDIPNPNEKPPSTWNDMLLNHSSEDLNYEDDVDMDVSIIGDEDVWDWQSDIEWMEAPISCPEYPAAIVENTAYPIPLSHPMTSSRHIHLVIPRRSTRTSVKGFRFPTEYSLGSFSREGGLPCLYNGSEMLIQYDSSTKVYSLFECGVHLIEMSSVDICDKLINGDIIASQSEDHKKSVSPYKARKFSSKALELYEVAEGKLSLYKTLQKGNSEYIHNLQNMDELPKCMEDFKSIFLYIEKKRHQKQPIFDITNAMVYESSVKCCYKVPRSSIFVYCAPGLKTSHHWTLSMTGGYEFSRCRPNVEMIELTNDRDHMYDEGDTMKPICIFTRELKMKHVSYLDMVHTHFLRLTSTTLMEEFLQLIKF
eukprot:scaffold63885_cov54-Attheya_sp.AAC.7